MLFDRYMTFSSHIEKIHKEIGKIKTRHMRQFGLKCADFSVMVMASRHPDGLTVTELAAACQVDKAVISRTVRTLLAKDYMEFVDGENHGHYRQKLRLTELGAETAATITGITEDAMNQVSHDIPQQQIDDFYRTLTRITQNMERLTSRKRTRKDTSS